MVLATQPANMAGPVIVIVMRFGPTAAFLAWLRRQDAKPLKGFDVEVGCVATGMIPPPTLLSCEGLCHNAPSINPAIP